MILRRRLNPKNDFLFKRLFGEEESKELLIGLLNAIFRDKGLSPIVNATVIENKELTRKLIDDKEGRLDVRCETNERVQINVEMQVERFSHMDNRSLFYLGKMYVDSIQMGGMYGELKKTIGINILDHSFLPLESYHSCFHLYEDDQRAFMLTDILEVHFIECTKFNKITFDINNDLHRWLRFMEECVTEEQLKELVEMDSLIRTAEERLAFLSGDEQMIRLYEAREEALYDRNSLMDDAMKEGRAVGRALGIAEGRSEGRSEGRVEERANLISSMLQKGLSAIQIAEFTGLTLEEVMQVKL